MCVRAFFLFFFSFLVFFFSLASLLSFPTNLAVKSTLATSNYKEQLHLAAAQIRPSPRSLSPSSQDKRLLPNSPLISCVNNTDISPLPRRKKGGCGGAGGRFELRTTPAKMELQSDSIAPPIGARMRNDVP